MADDWPQHGSFVRPRPEGNVHIALMALSGGRVWRMACGKAWPVAQLDPADGDDPRCCEKCREAM